MGKWTLLGSQIEPVDRIPPGKIRLVEMGQVLRRFLCTRYIQCIVAVGIIRDSTIGSYFHRSSAAALGLAFGKRYRGLKAAEIHHLLELWEGLILLTEVILTALFGLVLRTSISIKSDTDYLQMRCA